MTAQGHAGSAPATVDRIKRNLVSLKMPRALEILDVLVRGIERGETSPLEAIDLLLTEELTLPENRRVKMALLMARLSAIKTLASSRRSICRATMPVSPSLSMARGISSLLAKQNSSVWRVLRSTVKVIGITNFGRPPAAFQGWWDG
jgi:hypothetical protein